MTPRAAAAGTVSVEMLSPDDTRVGQLLPLGEQEPGWIRLVRVPAGVLLDEPVRVEVPETERSRLLVVAERGSKATVVDVSEHAGAHDVEVLVEDEASLEFVSLRMSDSVSMLRQSARLENGASIAWRNISVGGQTKHDLRSACVGRDATSTVDWIFFARGSEKQELTVRNVFDGANGGGEITMKGVAEEKGLVSCEGMIEIGLGGGGTNTYLTQDVLMLDPTAKVDAVPGLEIKTNDVKASHSATVSRVTVEDLFYFAARGIPAREARAMYVRGFLSDLLQRISDEDTRNLVQAAIDAKIQAST